MILSQCLYELGWLSSVLFLPQNNRILKSVNVNDNRITKVLTGCVTKGNKQLQSIEMGFNEVEKFR